MDVNTVAQNLAGISQWIDEGNAARDPEAATWARLAKITEEAGEVVAAYIGATGQNPRKGVTHTMDDVEAELLDVAATALTALEHLRGNDGSSLELFATKVQKIADRARNRTSSPTPRTLKVQCDCSRNPMGSAFED